MAPLPSRSRPMRLKQARPTLLCLTFLAWGCRGQRPATSGSSEGGAFAASSMTIRTTLEDADEEAQPVGPNFTPALSNRVGTNRREYMYRAYHPDRETVATSEASAKHSEEFFSGSFSEPAVGSGAGAGAGAAGVSRRTYSTITNTSTRDTVVEAVENYRSNSSQLRFGIINTGSPAFAQVMQGWDKGCREYGVSCYYVVSNGSECLEPRTTLLREYIEMGLDGIALKPCDEPVIRDLFEEANAAGIPVITFDSDVTNSTRDAFIGTDNVFVGNTLARLLRQLRPEGGTFCFVGDKEGRNAGFRDVITKYNNRSTSMGKWYEVPPAHNAEELQAEADWIALMEHCASHNPTGMVILYQSPMRNLTAWEEFVLANQWRNITYIGVDAADYQLDLLNRRLVDGLVGQLPYEIGELAVQVLFEKAVTGQLVRDFYPTNLVSYNLIPIELPPITVDQHLLGNLTILGYTCFAVIAAASIACAAWTRWNRTGVVVKAAQPIFLHMVAGGTILLSSALVPLSMDISDELFDATPMSYRVGICMSIPWLAFTGLTIVFAALFTKTWRVTRLFKSKSSPFSREQIAVRDVLAPFAGLLFCNIVVLICWTAIDPLTYTRVVEEGKDYWNRILSTYGACRSDHALAYLLPLAIINVSAVAIAAWQAYRARDIEDEFSESKYIGLAIYSMLQAFLTGVPVIAVVKDSPQSYYVLLTVIIFFLSSSWLLLIFLPKLLLHRKYSKLSEREQKQLLLQKVRESAGTSQMSFATPSVELKGPGDSRLGFASEGSMNRRSSESRAEEVSALDPIEEVFGSAPPLPSVVRFSATETSDTTGVDGPQPLENAGS